MSSFDPAPDLDAFHKQLEESLKNDEQSKEILITALVALGLIFLAIVAVVVFNVLKTYKGSTSQLTPPVVNPCNQPAFVVSGPQQCTQIPCAPIVNGQLASGFFSTMQQCMASITSSFYPVYGQDATSGASFAYCSTKQGNLPDGWSASSTVYFDYATCQGDAAYYNYAKGLGFQCDPQHGPNLCLVSSSTNCTPAPTPVLENPFNIGATGCVEYSGCNGGSCSDQYSTSGAPLVNAGMQAVGVGSCSQRDPCSYLNCTGVCMTYDSTYQTAAVGDKLQYGTDAVTVATGACDSSAKNVCATPYDCCDKIAADLKLTYPLYPNVNACPTTNTTFSCVADPSVTPAVCASGGCFQASMVANPQQPYWACSTYYGTGTDALAFSSYQNCADVIGPVNKTFLGLYCTAQGVYACNTSESSCTYVTDDVATNVGVYLSAFGKNPQKDAFDPPCVLRTSDCSKSCSFSQDATLTDCSTCPPPSNTCPTNTTGGWQCTSDAAAGAICTPTSGTTSLADACTAIGGQACGCSCTLPGQVCQNGNVIGAPCDTSITLESGSLPLTAACGPGSMMRSAMVWDPYSYTCLNGVPVTTSGPYATYSQQQPVTVCPGAPPTDGSFVSTSFGPNTVYFLNDPKETLQSTIPCPLSVYQACHGDSPIAPPAGDDSLPYCSYNAFAGMNAQGGFTPSNAMCVTNVVNMSESQNANVPVCMSFVQGQDQASFVMTGCVDAGAPGSMEAGTGVINNAVDPGTYCGMCSKSGSMTAEQLCPMAPANMSLVYNGSAVCQTISQWQNSSYLNLNTYYQADFSYFLTSLSGTTSLVAVPSVYAGLQGRIDQPYYNAAQCYQPPGLDGGSLGYCATTSTPGQGQCSGGTNLPVCQ